MEYQEFIDYISTLDFVPNKETADAMTKAVLGILCSSVDQERCRMLCDWLPEPLSVENLRGHQIREGNPSFREYIQEIRTQFCLSDDQAFELVDSVLRVTRDAAGSYAWNRFIEGLPADLGEAIKRP